MTVFPHLLHRRATFPFTIFDSSLKFELNLRVIENLKDYNELVQQSVDISDLLLSVNRRIEDRKIQNHIQNLRRDIFNMRLSRTDKVKGKISDFLLNRIEYFYHCLQKNQSDVISLRAKYLDLLAFNRGIVYKALHEQAIAEGILFSSFSLFDSIEKYDVSKVFKVKDRQRELSFLKYISRSFTKTSPFSSFNSIFLTNLFNEKVEISNSVKKGQDGLYNLYFYNNYIFRFFLDVTFSYAELYGDIKLRMNPSVVIKEDVVELIININNREAFQKIDFNEVIKFFYNYFIDYNDIKFTDLVLKASTFFESEDGEISVFIRELIDLGFLEWNLEISGRSTDWLAKLLDYYSGLSQTGLVKRVRNVLLLMDLRIKSFDCLDVYGKHRVLEEIHGVITEFSSFLQKTSVKDNAKSNSDHFRKNVSLNFVLRKEAIVYNDCFSESNISVDSSSLEDLSSVLERFLFSISIFNKSLFNRLDLHYFYAKHFPNEVQVDFLSFYRCYCENDSKFDNAKQIENSTLVRNQRHWFEFFNELVGKFDIESLDELDFKVDDLESFEFLEPLPYRTSNKDNSFGAFVQLFNVDGKLNCFVNNVFAGYGKMFSRFCHGFDDSLWRDILKSNRVFDSSENLFADNSDASFFNANLHPPLLDYEISVPGGHNLVDKDFLVLVSNLVVIQDNYSCRLKDKVTGKFVNVLDLGFEAYGSRSKLFVFLQLFTPVDYIFPNTFVNHVNSKFINFNDVKTYKDITVLPRISLDGSVYIQRKSWIINKEIFPVRSSTIDEFDFFLNVRKWQLENSLPESVYITINPQLIPVSVNTSNGKLGLDDRKPQYIEFSNPQFVLLLEKLVSKCPAYFIFQEVLPPVENLFCIDGSPVAVESLIQVQPY